MATYEENQYASKGVGTAGLTLGIIGTSLASGLLNNGGVSGLFGNRVSAPGTSADYLLSQKDSHISQLQAERYADSQVKELSGEVCALKSRVAAIEVAEPLREQILNERINCVANTVNKLVQPMIPNANVAPGWGPAFVSPFPPVPFTTANNSSGTSSTTTTTNG